MASTTGGVQPLHYIQFSPPAEARNVLFLGEDGRAIIHLHDAAIDVGRVALFVWPEVLGAFALLLLLVGGGIFLRRLRRPRRVGKLYCRRCNYELGELADQERLVVAGVPCSECGRSISERLLVRGRGRARRLGPVLALALVPALLYVGLLAAAGPSRNVELLGVLGSYSRRASEWTLRRDLSWFNQFREVVDVFEEWDFRAGQRVRTIRIGPGRTYFRPTLSPDGRRFFARGRAHNTIGAIEIESGRVAALLELPRSSRTAMREPAVVHLRDESDRAFVCVLDHDAGEHVLYAWDTRTGSASIVRREQAWAYAPGAPVERYIADARVDGRGVLVSLPTFMETYNRKAFEVRVIAPDGELLRTIEVDPVPEPDGGVVDAANGRLFVAHMELPVGVVRGIDLGSGEDLGRLRHGGKFSMHQAVTDGGRLLLVSLHDGSVLVRDAVRQEWLDPLAEATESYGLTLSSSEEGRWIAATGQRKLPGPKRAFAHDIIVWRSPDSWFAE